WPGPAEVGFQPGEEDVDQRALQPRVPYAGAERDQPNELPAVRSRQRHYDDAGRERYWLRTDLGRLQRSFQHERSGRPHRGVQPPAELLVHSPSPFNIAARATIQARAPAMEARLSSTSLHNRFSVARVACQCRST